MASLLAGLAAVPAALAAPQAQANLGRGLRELIEFQRGRADLAQPAARESFKQAYAGASSVTLDEAGRVLVEVQLNGQRPLAEVRQAAERLGAARIVEAARYRQGAMGAYVPVSRAAQLAQVPGVRSVVLSLPAVTNVARAVSQGAALIKSDQANALGFTGAGITVGALSDSYNVAFLPRTRADADVRSGDLPGAANPNGNLDPVVLIREYSQGTDEGRGMLQIIHDVAPAAKLCFTTAYATPFEFALGIQALADKAGRCRADVIVDDVAYLAEPMFSDGLIAQTVDEVAAQGVSYFSSAGNNAASKGFASAFRGVAAETARGQANSVDLSLIPAADTLGGFHNFNKAGMDIAQSVGLDGASNPIVFQWNDPFDTGGVTTDYDVYVFNSEGTQIVAQSTDDNLATGQPLEYVALPAGYYQIVIARADHATAKPAAAQMRYVNFGSVANGEYFDFATPTIYGHTAAAGALSTGAVPWYQPYTTEPFTSTGPVSIHFDAAGQRLARPVVRAKPDISAPDGGNTTFFGGDTPEDADNQPNFFGTSAAAPHAAGVAALLLQKAGGPGSLSGSDMRQLLQKSAPKHDLNPSAARAVAKVGNASVTVTAIGDGSNPSGTSPHAFSVTLDAPAGATLQNLTLDIGGANAKRVLLGVPTPGLQFDPRGDVGFPFVVGPLKNLAYSDISSSPLNGAAPFSQQLTISFAPGAFGSSSQMSFGVDRDEVATSAGGGSMDLLAGGTISGSVVDASGKAHAFSAPFKTGSVGKGFTGLDGYGLIDA
ncbi:MAG TPA: S8 family serine peptidase, partial [Ideonella sp.]|nr:S8 family serine peptidase [Ideonella sp.]